jgi:hypothetical protein
MFRVNIFICLLTNDYRHPSCIQRERAIHGARRTFCVPDRRILPCVLFTDLVPSTLLTTAAVLTLGSALEAGVSTIFVGLGEDPQVMADRSPALFAVRASPCLLFGASADKLAEQMIQQTYPNVAQPVGHV